MAGGNRHRIWYPEIVEALKSKWNDPLSNEELIVLIKELTEKVRSHRKKIGVQDPHYRCPECGEEHIIDAAVVSVGSLLSAAQRYGICSPMVYDDLTRSWRNYQKRNKLTRMGEPKTST